MIFDEWKRLILSDESFDRSTAADQPPDDGDEDEILELLIKSLDDPVSLVRTCAADSLGSFEFQRAKVALRKALEKEKDHLVRNYIIISLGITGEFQDLGDFTNRLRGERPEEYAALAEAIICLVTRLMPDLLLHAAKFEGNKSAGTQGLARSIEHLADALELCLKEASGLVDGAESRLQQVALERSLRIRITKAQES